LKKNNKEYLKLSEILELWPIPISRPTFLKGVAENIYPDPFLIVKKRKYWLKKDIEKFINKNFKKIEKDEKTN